MTLKKWWRMIKSLMCVTLNWWRSHFISTFYLNLSYLTITVLCYFFSTTHHHHSFFSSTNASSNISKNIWIIHFICYTSYSLSSHLILVSFFILFICYSFKIYSLELQRSIDIFTMHMHLYSNTNNEVPPH